MMLSAVSSVLYKSSVLFGLVSKGPSTGVEEDLVDTNPIVVKKPVWDGRRLVVGKMVEDSQGRLLGRICDAITAEDDHSMITILRHAGGEINQTGYGALCADNLRFNGRTLVATALDCAPCSVLTGYRKDRTAAAISLGTPV